MSEVPQVLQKNQDEDVADAEPNPWQGRHLEEWLQGGKQLVDRFDKLTQRVAAMMRSALLPRILPFPRTTDLRCGSLCLSFRSRKMERVASYQRVMSAHQERLEEDDRKIEETRTNIKQWAGAAFDSKA
jgi:hypothetical protein